MKVSPEAGSSSAAITMQGTSEFAVERFETIFFTVPLTGEWTGALTKASLFAMTCPRATLSPTATTGWFGAPPIVMGIVSVLEAGKAAVIFFPSANSLCSGG